MGWLDQGEVTARGKGDLIKVADVEAYYGGSPATFLVPPWFELRCQVDPPPQHGPNEKKKGGKGKGKGRKKEKEMGWGAHSRLVTHHHPGARSLVLAINLSNPPTVAATVPSPLSLRHVSTSHWWGPL